MYRTFIKGCNLIAYCSTIEAHEKKKSVDAFFVRSSLFHNANTVCNTLDSMHFFCSSCSSHNHFPSSLLTLFLHHNSNKI